MTSNRALSIPIAGLLAAAVLITPATASPVSGAMESRTGNPLVATGLQIHDHTLIMQAVIENGKLLMAAVPRSSVPRNDIPLAQQMRVGALMLRALINVNRVSLAIKAKARAALLGLNAAIRQVNAMSAADRQTGLIIRSHLAKLLPSARVVSRMIAYLQTEAVSLRLAKRSALAARVSEAASLLQDGSTTIYNSAWLAKNASGMTERLHLATALPQIAIRHGPQFSSGCGQDFASYGAYAGAPPAIFGGVGAAVLASPYIYYYYVLYC